MSIGLHSILEKLLPVHNVYFFGATLASDEPEVDLGVVYSCIAFLSSDDTNTIVSIFIYKESLL